MELLTSLAAPVITGAVTLIGILIANRKSAAVREVREEMERKELQEWRDRIEQKLDEHNEYGKKWQDTLVFLTRVDERLKSLEGKQ